MQQQQQQRQFAGWICYSAAPLKSARLYQHPHINLIIRPEHSERSLINEPTSERYINNIRSVAANILCQRALIPSLFVGMWEEI